MLLRDLAALLFPDWRRKSGTPKVGQPGLWSPAESNGGGGGGGVIRAGEGWDISIYCRQNGRENSLRSMQALV